MKKSSNTPASAGRPSRADVTRGAEVAACILALMAEPTRRTLAGQRAHVQAIHHVARRAKSSRPRAWSHAVTLLMSFTRPERTTARARRMSRKRFESVFVGRAAA